MILIDMPMPDNCLECRFNTSEFGYCNAMPVEFVGQVSDFEEDGKPAWCPLKAQEPRVMTAADFDNNPNTDSQGFLPAWIEYRRDGEWGEYWADDDDEWTSVRVDNFEGYGYRCWTSRPTDEQREAVKWE